MRLSIKVFPLAPSQLVLGGAAMGSGGALVVTIIAKTPRWATLLLFAIYGLSIAGFVWSRASTAGRLHIVRQAKFGCLAGVTATAAMDGWRVLLTVLIQFSAYAPFETFALFGQSIGGTGLTHESASPSGRHGGVHGSNTLGPCGVRHGLGPGLLALPLRTMRAQQALLEAVGKPIETCCPTCFGR
jgi:hypothetical protein